MLSGYKTYLAGAAAIFGALAAYASGEIELATLAQLIVTAVLAMTVRHGVSTNA